MYRKIKKENKLYEKFLFKRFILTLTLHVTVSMIIRVLSLEIVTKENPDSSNSLKEKVD